ncbi:hypothetical protein AU194_17765 [Mycobacterium sp. GA-2829]|nr:hypothetical protein AU194_17765 [Mycobacterium sp. GA-2829]
MTHSVFRGIAVTVALALAVAGCSSTVTGAARRAPDKPGSGGAVVALMNTGRYATTPSQPLGVAGDDKQTQNLVEAQRMAEFVLGPWEVDEKVNDLPGMLDTVMTGPVADANQLHRQYVLPAPLADIAARHGYVTAFSTFRVSDKRSLQNVVLRFADPAGATAAADEMAAADPGPPSLPPMPPNPPPRDTPFPEVPEARVKTWDLPDSYRVHSFTAHGPYVLYQSAAAKRDPFVDSDQAAPLVTWVADRQPQRLDDYTPTPLDKLAELPKDFTGRLLALTLPAPTGEPMPFVAGAWKPSAWLHFEPNPVAAQRYFDEAGVTVVTQRLTTVYEASDSGKATGLANQLAQQILRDPTTRSIEGVKGLPAAKCFVRTDGAAGAEDAASWQRVYWAFKCVAYVDRWAYTAYSATELDVKQQMSAQYRILAGE